MFKKTALLVLDDFPKGITITISFYHSLFWSKAMIIKVYYCISYFQWYFELRFIKERVISEVWMYLGSPFVLGYLWFWIFVDCDGGLVGSESVDGTDKDNPGIANTLFQHLRCHNRDHHHHYHGWLIPQVEYKPQRPSAADIPFPRHWPPQMSPPSSLSSPLS